MLKLFRTSKITRVIFCIITILAIGCGFLIYMFDFNINGLTMEEYYGDKYPYVLHADVYSIFGINIYKSLIYKPSKDVSIDKASSEKETFSTIIDTITPFKYDDIQNNPNLIEDFGGNCQAISLLLDAYCKNVGIESYIKYNAAHMWNIVRLDGVLYKVDLVNGKMIKL